MTLDEAIVHAREVASEQKRRSGACVQNDSECDKFSTCLKCAEEHEQLAKWLEELKEYQAIGTPKECRAAVEVTKSMLKRNFTKEIVTEYMKFEDECVKQGFSFNSLLEAREKQTAKKCSVSGDGYADGHLVYDTYECPNCGKEYEIDYDRYKYCPNCGQHLIIELDGEEE